MSLPIESRPTAVIERKKPSPREREVLNLLAQGYERNEIVDMLHISLATVRTHIGRLYRKYETNPEFSAEKEDNEATKLVVRGIPFGDIELPPLLTGLDETTANSLTPREKALMEFIVTNNGTTVIRRRLGKVFSVSETTVRSHLSSIYTKLNARNKPHAVARYMAGRSSGIIR